MNRPLSGLWITLAGCLSPVDLGPPELAGSTLGLWVIGPPEQRALIAFDPANPIYPGPSTLQEGWLIALGFQGLTLEQLGLSAGDQDPVPEGRPLPPPDARVRWTAAGWLPDAPNLEGLESLRLPPILAASCSKLGLCLDSRQGRCEPCGPNPTAVVAPTSPSPPAPLEARCPPGWRQVGPQDRLACEWLHPGPCGPGEVAFPGERACGPLLAPCPPGDDFPPAASGRTLHVRAGASGGDGTPSAPLGQLEEALALAFAGDRVALAPGRYTAAEIPASVEVVGACAERVVLEGATLRLLGGTLRDLSLEVPLLISGTSTLAGITSRGVGGVAINVEAGAVVKGRRISIQGAGGGGIVVTGAHAELQQVEVQGSGRFGLWVSGSTVSVDAASMDPRELGAIVATRSRLSLHDFLIDGRSGRGIDAQQSRLELGNGAVSITNGQGISLHRGQLSLRQLWLRAVPLGAVALVLAAGELTDLRVEGTPLHLTAAVRSDGSSGLSVDRAVISGFAAGLRLVSTPGTLRDLVITDLLSTDLNAPRSVGIQANGEGPFTIERARIGGFLGHAIAIAGAGVPGQEILPSLVRVEDLEAFALSADLEDKGGVGFFEEGALLVELRRLRLEDTSQRGVEIRGFPRGTDLRIEDLYVQGAAIGLERSGYGPSTLQRAELRDISQRGVELRGRPMLAQALRVVGTGGLRGLSLTPSEVNDEPVEIRDFQILGPLGAAVVANGSVRGIRLVDGEIAEVDVAYGLPEEGEIFEIQNVSLRQGAGQRVSAVGVP